MNLLQYFFRGTPDNYHFQLFSPVHFALIGIALLGVILIVGNKEALRSPKLNKSIGWLFVFLLFGQQLVLYLWYGFSGYFLLSESLPLYNCRIAILFTALGLITHKKLLINIGCYWGVLGSIVALAMPNPDPFLFPHYTLVSFFGGHMVLLWANMFVLVVNRYAIDKKSLFTTLLFTNIYHALLLPFNIATGSNYCYLLYPPFFGNLFVTPLAKAMYLPLIFLLFSLLMVGFYAVIHLLCQKQWIGFEDQSLVGNRLEYSLHDSITGK